MIATIKTRMLCNDKGIVSCKMSARLICGKAFNEKSVHTDGIAEYVHQQWYFALAQKIRKRVTKHVEKHCKTCRREKVRVQNYSKKTGNSSKD